MRRIVFTGLLIGTLGLGSSSALAAEFNDVYSADPLTEALEYLIESEVVEGYDDGGFHPLSLINRAEFTKMMVVGVAGVVPDETLYKNCFTDVQEEWFAKYVCQAEEWGWIQGYGDGRFEPADPITRAEAIKILSVALEWSDPLVERSVFWDNLDSSQWFYAYLLQAEERELLDTLDGYVSPHELINRSQMATLLYRALRYEDGAPVEPWTLEAGSEWSYEEVLATGLTAAYPGDMTFPHNPQTGWPYGCYSFATKNIMEFKYGEVLDIAEVQERIGWDGSFIWSPTEFSTFASEYDVDVVFSYQNSAEFFFKKLAQGQPLILYIPYESGGVNIGHQLVAYSFDADGVWVADSLSGGLQRQIPYSDVFVDGSHTTTNLTELRKVKDGGERKDQSFR